MRLFVAVDIDAATREQLRAARRTLEPLLSNARIPPRITWVNPDSAHVTLRFLGEIPEHSVKPIQDALGAALVEPFDVTWQSTGTFGGTRHPRVVLVSPSTGEALFIALAARVSKRLDPVLGRGEDRPFKPHVTIARVRDAGRGVDWAAALEALKFTPTVTRVDHVTLYQSHLSSKGPTYTALSTHG